MVSALSAKIAQFIYSEDLIWCSVKILCKTWSGIYWNTDMLLYIFYIFHDISSSREVRFFKMPEMPSAAQSVHEEVSLL